MQAAKMNTIFVEKYYRRIPFLLVLVRIGWSVLFRVDQSR